VPVFARKEITLIERNTPEFLVQDVDATVRYYVEALGFAVDMRVPEDDAQPAEWAMVKRDGASFMFEKREPFGNGEGVDFYLHVTDVNVLLEELRRRGAEIVGEPEDTWYGMRNVTVRDPNGYELIFASPVPAKENANA
jgi:uncharacterized glyoxalase superfamily protein PhnB